MSKELTSIPRWVEWVNCDKCGDEVKITDSTNTFAGKLICLQCLEEELEHQEWLWKQASDR